MRCQKMHYLLENNVFLSERGTASYTPAKEKDNENEGQYQEDSFWKKYQSKVTPFFKSSATMDSVSENYAIYTPILLSYCRRWYHLLFYSLVLVCGIVFFNFAWRRRKYSKLFPSRSMKFIDLKGSIRDFTSNAQVRGTQSNVYLLQAVMGYSELFKRENLFYFWVSYVPLVVIHKAEAVEKLISGTKNLEKNFVYNWLHPWLGTGLLTSHGSKWKSRRKLLTPSFHFDILKDFMPVFNEQSQLLVKLLKKETEKPWTDIVKMITLCSLDIVCETTLGVSVGAQQNSDSEYVRAVLRAAEVLMHRFSHPSYIFDWAFQLSSLGMQFKNDTKLLHNFTFKVIRDKKQILLEKKQEITQKKRKALMDLLLEEHIQNQKMSEEDIREEIDTFAFEGHDTTSMGMSWALYLIGLHPDVQEKVHEEMDRIFGDDAERPVTTEDIKNMEYLDRVLKESQRLYPSVPMFGRQLTEDTTLCGSKIPKGCATLVFTYGLHRDEDVFPNPEKFDPDRFLPENSVKRHPFAYIPFSAGPRNCIGQRFAIMEEKVVLANIFRTYSVMSLDSRDKVLPATELILRAANPIRVKLNVRTPTY